MKTIGLLSSRTRQTEADYDALHTAFAVIYDTGDKITTLACQAHIDPWAERIVTAYPISVFTIYRAEDPVILRAVRNLNLVMATDVLIVLRSTSPAFTGTEDLIREFVRVKGLQKLVAL